MRILISVLALWALAGTARAADETFRDWWAACDEQRACWAFGFSEDGADAMGFVRLERGGAAGTEPALVLGAGRREGSGEAKRTRMAVSVDGAAATTVTGERDGDSDPFVARVDDPAAARALIAALRNGRTLELQPQGWREPARVSLSGAAAALLWLDEQQKRLGTVTALARPGARPASAVPPIPPARMVRAAPAAAQARLPKTWPRFVLQQPEVRECLDEVSSDELKQPQVARLDARTILWGVTCAQGAYQSSVVYYLGDETGAGWTRAPFDPAPPEGEDQWVTNGDFDPKSMTLSAFAKGRGIGDCGEISEWVWTGKAFVLTERTSMPYCRQLPWDYWPTTVKREVRR